MEKLFEISDTQLSHYSHPYRRFLYDQIPWEDRLIGIKGPRGTGKTTLLIQRMQQLGMYAPDAVYLSLDDLHFTGNTLLDTVDQLVRLGGKYLYLDEVHKYQGWAREVKLIYDRFPKLKVVFTGSSVMDIAKEESELGRRVLLFDLPGLSYREYLQFSYEMILPVLALEDLLSKPQIVRETIPPDFRPLQYFTDYLISGYYPFSTSQTIQYHQRLRQMIRFVIEYDMASMREFDLRNARKVMQLVTIIAGQAPFKPNYSSLAQKTGIHRNSLAGYMLYLERARVVNLLYPHHFSVASLQKPEKIFLENTNLMHALADQSPSAGAIRETFVFNQVSQAHQVRHPQTGDFHINDRWIFESGGKTKGTKQLVGQKDAYIISDHLEYPVSGKIPLWTLGFLY